MKYLLVFEKALLASHHLDAVIYIWSRSREGKIGLFTGNVVLSCHKTTSLLHLELPKLRVICDDAQKNQGHNLYADEGNECC